MAYYTDIAAELYAKRRGRIPTGVTVKRGSSGQINITRVDIARDGLHRPRGTYITLDICAIGSHAQSEDITMAVAQQLRGLLPASGSILVVGVGNRAVIADSLGPVTADKVLATRKLSFSGIPLRCVAVIAPGVAAATGLEPAEIVKALVARLCPCAVLCIDSLCTSSIERLGTSVQLSTAGLTPHNGRVLSAKALGVPVLAIGIPTVMQQRAYSGGYLPPALTPKDIDNILHSGAQLLALAINKALQPTLSLGELHFITS